MTPVAAVTIESNQGKAKPCKVKHKFPSTPLKTRILYDKRSKINTKPFPATAALFNSSFLLGCLAWSCCLSCCERNFYSLLIKAELVQLEVVMLTASACCLLKSYTICKSALLISCSQRKSQISIKWILIRITYHKLLARLKSGELNDHVCNTHKPDTSLHERFPSTRLPTLPASARGLFIE